MAVQPPDTPALELMYACLGCSSRVMFGQLKPCDDVSHIADVCLHCPRCNSVWLQPILISPRPAGAGISHYGLSVH